MSSEAPWISEPRSICDLPIPKGYLYQRRPGGTWRFRLSILSRTFNGSTHTCHRSKAEEYVADFSEDFILRCPEAPPPQAVTWAGAVDLWVRLTRHTTSREHRRNLLTVHQRHLNTLHHRLLEDITDDDVGACIKDYLSRHPKGTPEGIIRVISLLLRWAVAHRFLDGMTVELPSPRPPRTIRPHVIPRRTPEPAPRVAGPSKLFDAVMQDPAAIASLAATARRNRPPLGRSNRRPQLVSPRRTRQ